MESHEKYQLVIFQSHIAKFDQKMYCTLSFNCTRLCARYSMKEAILPIKRSKEHHKNTVCMNF